MVVFPEKLLKLDDVDRIILFLFCTLTLVSKSAMLTSLESLELRFETMKGNKIFKKKIGEFSNE